VTPTAATDRREAIRALAAVADTPSPEVAAALGLGPIDPADHTEVFAFQAPPYASVYLDPTGMLGGEVAARIGGFWQALGYPVPDQPDHLTSLLGLYAALDERAEQAEAAPQVMLTQARHALATEHLLPWVGFYLDVVENLAIGPWDRWATLTRAALDAMVAPAEAPTPRHLVEAPPPLDDWKDVSGLLTPVRSGIVITRADLVDCARHSRLGVRLTGRAPTLRALLDQSPGTVADWLEAHAAEWQRRHTRRDGTDGFWTQRARHLGRLLATDRSR
jgi:hypothetical protein